jgi:hypothetical protein
LKKLILVASLALLATPYLASARDRDDDNEDEGPRHMSATEVVGAGAVGASLIGLVGYLALRRRSSRQS